MSPPVLQTAAADAEGEMPPRAPAPPPGPTRAGGLVGRVGRAAGALSLGTLVSALGPVAIVPVALLAWGQVRYGEWVVITGFVTFLRLTDLGMQTYVVNRFGADYATGNLDGVRSALHSSLRVQIPLFGLLFVVLAAALRVLPMREVLGVETVAGTVLYAALLLLALEFLIGVPMGVVSGVYRATGHLSRAAMIGAVQQLAALLITVGLIAGNASFAVVAAGRLAVPVAGTLFVVRDLRRLHPWLGLWPRAGSWREGAAMVVPGLFFLLFPLADYLSSQVTLLMVQQHLDGAAVSRLATHRTVVNVAQMASNLLIAAVWYELTGLHAQGERDRLWRVLRRLVTLNVWLVGAATVGMLPFVGWLYPGWTAGKLALDWWTLGLLIARVVVWSGWNASMTLLVSTNRHRRSAFALLGAATISCAAAALLVPVLGIRGAAAATLVGDLLLPAWLIPRLAARESGMSAWGLAAEAVVAFARGIAAPALLAGALWLAVPYGPVRYGVVLPLAALLALRLMWGHIPPPERAPLVEMARRRLRRPAAGNP